MTAPEATPDREDGAPEEPPGEALDAGSDSAAFDASDAADADATAPTPLDPDGGPLDAGPLTELDLTFGTGGRVTVTAPTGLQKFLPPSACLVSDTGAITIGGALTDPAGVRTGALVRVESDGVIDSAFGSAGIVAENFGLPYGVVAAALLETPSGGLRVFGHAAEDRHGFFAAQRLASGGPDTSFATNGLWRTPLDSETLRDGASVVVPLATGAGDVLVGGWHGDGNSRTASAWKFASSPTFGPGVGFGNSGSRSSVLPPGAKRAAVLAAAVQSTGAIVLSGEYQTATSPRFYPFVTRLLSDGQLDATFGEAGWALVDGSLEGSAAALGLLADGRLVVGGYRRGPLSLQPTLWRLSADGTPDLTFGVSGALAVPFGEDSGRISDLRLDAAGRMSIAATLSSLGHDKAGVARLLASGTFDPTFVGTGFFIQASQGSVFASRIVMDDLGRTVVAGSTSSGELLLWRFAAAPAAPPGS